jgi:hypothetical protein
VEDEHGALVDGQSTKAPFKLVLVGDVAGVIAVGGRFGGSDGDFHGAPALTSSDVMAGVDDQSMEPGIETIGVAQTAKVPPGSKVSVLDRVARELWVPEDEAGDGLQPRDGPVDEDGEGVMIAPACPFDEFPLVHSHPLSRSFGRVHRV